MKKIEFILGSTTLIAIILNLFDYPMSTPLLLVSIGNLSLFYMYLSMPLFNDIPVREMFSRSSYEGISKGRFIGSLAVGLTFSATLIGLLFKLMIWPNAIIELLISLTGLSIGLGIGIWRYRMQQDDFYLKLFRRIAAFFVLAILGLVLPKYAILEFKYANYPSYIEAFKARSENPNNEKLMENLEIQRQLMLEEMQKEHPEK